MNSDNAVLDAWRFDQKNEWYVTGTPGDAAPYFFANDAIQWIVYHYWDRMYFDIQKGGFLQSLGVFIKILKGSAPEPRFHPQ